MRILLAEDDHHVAIIMQLCLQHMGGHTVTICEDGEICLSKALDTSLQFDLILLDGMMPKKHGLQVAQELRDLAYPVPIIFLSAKSDERDVRDFLALSIGYIAKPFEPTEICSKIDEILQKHAGAKAA